MFAMEALLHMTKCVFCGKEVEPFRGVHLIKNDGSVNFLCSSKCRRNALYLKRDKKKMKWTEAYGVALEKTRKSEKYEQAKADAKAEANKNEKK